MNITKIQVTKGDWGTTKAMVSITFDDCFVVSGLKVIEGQKGAFVAMPNRKLQDGTYKDTCFPITAEFRTKLRDAVLAEYNGNAKNTKEESEPVYPF
jgi:stage V sporulation protein G